MRYRIFLAVILFLASHPLMSQAGSFSVVGENKNWISASGNTLNYRIGIENPTGTSELLLLWELNLAVRPASAETKGDIFIASASQPSRDYLLEGRTTGLNPPFAGPEKSIEIIGDADEPLLGVPVPNKGKNLLELVLHASDDAQGLFNIEVQPMEVITFWATLDDLLLDPPVTRAFENLPFNSTTPVTIGTVMIQKVPEPSSLAILSIGLVLFLALRLRQRPK